MELHLAPSPEELRRRLVLFPGVADKAANHCEPWMLLSSQHKHEPEGALSTALLLLTDQRWINGAGRLIRQIERSGLLPEADLDALARAFLTADHAAYWEAPSEWFSPSTDGGPVMVAREVRPPLRRWAAVWEVRRTPSHWAGLVQRAREVDGPASAAIMCGLLEALDVLAPETQELVINLAADWPQREVRKGAAAASARPVRSSPTIDPPEPAPQASLF